jgi:tetraprenyl-beta-curcumene synthase
LWGLRAVSCKVNIWRSRARTIPDTATREVALNSLVRKRPHIDGAALFWIIPRHRNTHLLGLLVAYEEILEFLDDLDEHTLFTDGVNGRQLHRALAEAVAPDIPISDYYLHHPHKDDGGYLRAFVEVCRQGCASLPGYPAVGALVRREAARAEVLALNHDPQHYQEKLKEWTEREFTGYEPDRWFEPSGAATASLTVHALLALAAESSCVTDDIKRVQTAYFPWLSLTATMLDSYVDSAEDTATGNHSYINHYTDFKVAQARIEELIRRSAREVLGVRRGHRHAVILACMIAMYMSRDSARTAERRRTSRCFVEAGGSLTSLLMPILRIWRSAYALRAA